MLRLIGGWRVNCLQAADELGSETVDEARGSFLGLAPTGDRTKESGDPPGTPVDQPSVSDDRPSVLEDGPNE